MRNLCNYLILSAVCLCPLGAQTESEQGFLNIANLALSDKPCKITIAGKDLVPGGLKSIESTGWFIVPVGEHPMVLEIEGHKTASGVITVSPNLSTLYALFFQQIGDKTDKDGKEIPPQVRIKRCEAFEESKGHFLKAMSLCPEEERFDIGPHVLRLKLFGTEEIPGWNGGAFAVKHGNDTIGSNSGAAEKGSYMLLIGSDQKGKYASLLVRNEKQELPPWMKKDKDKIKVK